MIAIRIIYYNHKKVRLGNILCAVGAALLFLNAIPYIWANFGMALAYPAIAIIFLGLGFIHFYTYKISEIGKILIDEYKTTIINETSKFEIINKEYFTEFSNDGYRGEESLISYLQFGTIIPNHGINTLKFFNDKNTLKYEVVIASKNQLTNLKKVLAENFKKIDLFDSILFRNQSRHHN